jgi:hypothetical protein
MREDVAPYMLRVRRRRDLGTAPRCSAFLRSPNTPGSDAPSVIAFIFCRRHPGSIPVLRIIGPASGAVRNFTSALAASGAVTAVCRPAENTVMCWMSGGRGPR